MVGGRRTQAASELGAAPPHAGRVATIGAAIVIITFIAFRGALANAFVSFDDDVYVSANAHVRSGLTLDSVSWAFTSLEQGNWHPLTWLSHMLDVQLYGLNPGKHHLTSVLLHAVNAVLLFLVLLTMTGALWRSAFVACLFAIHPLHVESVAWIAERKDVLSTLFWLLTLSAWISYLRSMTPWRYALAVACYAAGLMAKPMLVTLPFTLLLLDYWPLRRGWRFWEKMPLFGLSGASCVVTFIAQQRGGAVQTLHLVTFTERLANAVLAYQGYLSKTFRPASLAILYPHEHYALLSPTVGWAALFLTGITVAALRYARQAPFLVVGWLWYLGTLVPVIGLIQVGGQAMADRYTYVPLIGIFIAIAWGWEKLAALSRTAGYVVPAMAIVAIVSLGAMTDAQIRHWSGSEALYRHALAVTSNNWMADYKLGTFLNGEGRNKDAVTPLTQAVRLTPDFADAHLELGNALAVTGRLDDAVAQYTEAMRLDPASPGPSYNLGVAMSGAGRLDEAADWFGRSLRAKPEQPEARAQLASVYYRQGRFPEAVEQYDLSLGGRPDDAATLNNAGLALSAMRRFTEAIERFQQAVRLDPGFADAHNNLGAALASVNRLPEAIAQFEEAVRLAPDFGRARANLERARRSSARAP